MRFYFGYLVGVVITILNLNTLLYKATPIIRGDLVGTALEMALLKIVAFPAIAVVGAIMVCVHIRELQLAHDKTLKEKKKCGNSCNTPG